MKSERPSTIRQQSALDATTPLQRRRQPDEISREAAAILNEAVKGLTANQLDDALIQVLREWAESAPVDAAAWAQLHANAPWAATAIDHVAIIWANVSSVDSIAWARKLPSGTLQSTAITAIGVEVARTDPRLAATLAEEFSSDGGQDFLLKHSIRQWAATDPHDAMLWIAGTAPLRLGNTLLIEASAETAERDPTLAASLLLAELEDSPQRTLALNHVMQRWTQRSLESPARWINSQPLGEDRDAAIIGLIDALDSKEPALALRWTQAISDPAKRNIVQARQLNQF